MVALRLWALLAQLLALAALSIGRSSTGDSVLVVLDPSLKQEDYSLFFNGLKSMLHIHA
jgi:oligosaccharyltransferase complex subunit beta